MGRRRGKRGEQLRAWVDANMPDEPILPMNEKPDEPSRKPRAKKARG